MTMKFLLSTIVLFSAVVTNNFAQTRITSEELNIVVGEWEGSLTYLDYQTGEPFTMPTLLTISKGKSENSLVLDYIYPNEPKANNSTKVSISKQGEKLNGRLISSKESLENGNLIVTTEHDGKDDSKKAQIRYNYLLGQSVFQIEKEVRFEGSEEWIRRNFYTYQRKK